MSLIQNIFAREVLDSRGNPTVEVEVLTDDGIIGRAIVPSGASTGAHEALELRDGDKSRFNGKGVLKAVNNVNTALNKELSGYDVLNQEKIDKRMIELDGTENKSKLGANSILGVSMAVCRVAAQSRKVDLYAYFNPNAHVLPVPLMNIMNGGQHADSGLDIQEFKIIPAGAPTFREALRMGAEIFHALKKILKKHNLQTGVGDEGGFAPHLDSNEKALDLILEAISETSYTAGKDVFLGLDVAASEFYDLSKGYTLKINGNEEVLNSSSLTDFYEALIAKYPIISIEDSHAEDDFSGWQEMMKRLGSKIQLIGDDFLVTNVNRLRKAISLNAANSILIKLNQIGTVTETILAIKEAQKHGWHTVVSHRSGETEDTFIADLAVGLETGQIKTGSLSRTDRICKYNQLLRIEEKLGLKATYYGTQKTFSFC